jgi:hypothetical protein
VGLRTGLDMVLKRKIPSPPPPESNTDHPVVQPVANFMTCVSENIHNRNRNTKLSMILLKFMKKIFD